MKVQKCLMQESNAVHYCLEYLKKHKGYSWDNLEYINKGRYCIVDGEPKISIILKKAWFEKFGNKGFLNEVTGMPERGLGDSINVDDIKTFIQRGIEWLYIVYYDGKIYNISLYEFLKLSHRWLNKEGKEVRSINIHYYNRVNV